MANHSTPEPVARVGVSRPYDGSGSSLPRGGGH
jgi:hypothetical protein